MEWHIGTGALELARDKSCPPEEASTLHHECRFNVLIEGVEGVEECPKGMSRTDRCNYGSDAIMVLMSNLDL